MSGKQERERRRQERIHAQAKAKADQSRRRRVQLLSAAAFVGIVVVVILVVAIGQGGGGSGGDTSLEDVGLVEEQLAGIHQHGTVLGDPSAKVTLIEFGDLQCPICKAFSEEVLPSVIAGSVSRGEAKIDFRNYTIISQQSVPAGAAALAAGEQGRGWNFIDIFYRNQGEERSGYVTDSFLTSIAKGAKVPDMARWNRERKSQRLLREVERTTQEAEGYGFEGTPSFYVEGPGGSESIGTPESMEELEVAIQEAE
jgi:protein-disulfide isomerase